MSSFYLNDWETLLVSSCKDFLSRKSVPTGRLSILVYRVDSSLCCEEWKGALLLVSMNGKSLAPSISWGN